MLEGQYPKHFRFLRNARFWSLTATCGLKRDMYYSIGESPTRSRPATEAQTIEQNQLAVGLVGLQKPTSRATGLCSIRGPQLRVTSTTSKRIGRPLSTRQGNQPSYAASTPNYRWHLRPSQIKKRCKYYSGWNDKTSAMLLNRTRCGNKLEMPD